MEAQSPVCIDDFEQYAIEHLDRNTLNYYQSGANNNVTLADNVNAYRRYKIRPRVLRDVSKVDLSTTILGQRIQMPICIAPTARQKLAHEDGEVATAQAAADLEVCYTVSLGSTCSYEELDAVQGLRWLQLYFTGQRATTEKIVRKAESFGYKALVVTVDGAVDGYRTDLLREPLKTPKHIRTPILDDLKLNDRNNATEVKAADATVKQSCCCGVQSPSTWNDIKWLKEISSLPVVLKGILTAEDADIAVQYGVDGIIVSNQGGRQLDSVPATIDVLPEVVAAVDGRCEVYVDGGVRSGIDVFKAIALGARAVFVGRPILWGLAYNGTDGVSRVLKILQEEFKIAMKLSGTKSVCEIGRQMVAHKSSYTGGSTRTDKKLAL